LALGAMCILMGCNRANYIQAKEKHQRGEYFEAANLYRKVYAHTSSKDKRKKGEIAFSMGECYEKINYLPRALNGYQNALRYRVKDSVCAFRVAQILYRLGKYQQATQNLKEYLTLYPNHRESNAILTGSTMAQQWKETPTPYIVKKSRVLNSRRSDFSPLIVGEFCDNLYYTSSNDRFSKKYTKSPVTGVKDYDIFFSKKNEKGIWITPAFPKLIYVLEEDNIHEDSKYYHLTKLAAKCTAKRLVPDYISEKIMMQNKIDKNGEGHCYTCMGCRSFLTPYVDENGKPKYYGRFNQGVVTVNLVDIGLSAEKNLDKFWTIFDERMNLCHRALQARHDRLMGTVSDVAPILWQHGALLRLEKGETIDKYLYGGYSTLSLGYAGLWECVYSLIGKKLTEPQGEELGLQIMKKLNEYTSRWKAEENIDYSLYGTPLESTTYKFAKCLQKRFGIINGVTDKNYITNSYHVHVTENIDAFSKLALESKFQVLSPGGAISYVEVPNMQGNLDAVLSIMQFIYDHIMYAELNTKSDYCQECGYDGEIEIKENEDGKLVWQCPNCGNTDQNRLNVARRTCGYIGTQFWNQGRTQEIKERVLHL